MADLDTRGVTGRFNFLLTDGAEIAATAAGDTLCYRAGAGQLTVGSEPSDDEPGWITVPDRSVLTGRPGAVEVSAAEDSQRRRRKDPEPVTDTRSELQIDRMLPDGFLAGALRADVRAGLSASPKFLPPKWFYDERGSELFEKITLLPEYYPTRTERSILAAAAPGIAAATGAAVLVELGSGSSEKTRLLLDALRDAGTLRSYVPVDVSETALIAAARRVQASYPGLGVRAVVSDFEEQLGVPDTSGPRLVAFLGSTIGNLLPDQRAAFLARLRAGLHPGDALLLGTDLVKDPAVLLAAYDDAAGVTAAFNKNVLSVLNTELGADFDAELFDHMAVWDPQNEWIEMRLRSAEEQTVRLPGAGLTVQFAAGEQWRTEVSAKFRRAGVAGRTGRRGLPAALLADRPAGPLRAVPGRAGLSSPSPVSQPSSAGQAAGHGTDRDPVQPEQPDQLADHPVRVDRAAAEQVHRDQVFLRPGVDAQVRLGQDEHQGDRAVGEHHVAGMQHVTLPGGHRAGRRAGQLGQVSYGGSR